MSPFAGPLVSYDCLRRIQPPAGALPEARLLRFEALRREALLVLGPALHARAITAMVALPLARWLGWPAPLAEGVSGDACSLALVAAGAEPVRLIVAHAVTGPLTRQGIRQVTEEGGRWLLLTDGRTLRVCDATLGHDRGIVDIDLDRCRDDAGALAWVVSIAGPRAFMTGAGALPAIAARSHAYGRRVCASLREGVGQALDTMTAAVAVAGGSRRGLAACYADARTAVYRVLFLLFAEARHLVPLWHPIYRRGYAIDTLGTRLASGGSPKGTWAALQAVARLAHAGAQAGDLRVVPFNGRLFSPARAPLLDHLSLDDRRVSRALTALCFMDASDGLTRIAYADLGVEELGSVYESLLDREPLVDGSRSSGVAPARVGSARKTTGTFYTPRALADALVHEALEPLVRGKTPEEILKLRVLDPAMGSGAFLVSAGRFLAASWESAMAETGRAGLDGVGEDERAEIRRRIASQCLFGVDRNPMAVQLAQLSIWLATLASDKPLSFLDHHLVAGNSLIGTSPVDVLARPPGRAARAGPLPLDHLFDWSAPLVPVRQKRASIEAAADDTVDAVDAKDRALRALEDDDGLGRWKRACDLWCAAWIRPEARGVYHALLDAVLEGSRGGRTVDAAGAPLRSLASALGCFHWPLEFPEVFLDEQGRPRPDGGFDAVVGNPPWEMLRRDAGRHASARDEGAATVRFARRSGIYRCQGRGHANQVQLFVERALQLARPGGRVGLLVPATVLTDEGSAPIRRALILGNALDAVSVYENRRGIFPIHRSVRFATVVATRYGRTTDVACRFGLHDAVPGRATPPAARARLTPALLERLSGPGLAIPDLPTPADVVLVERLTRCHPVLADRAGWGVTFGRELNASDDRDCFRQRSSGARGWPVVEGRHLAAFRVDLAGTSHVADRQAAAARLGGRAGPTRPRLAYRDVASATNRMTLIAAIVPADTVTVHTVFCLREALSPAAQRVLCALMNSFVANYLVRRRVTTHVTTAVVATLPVPRVDGSAPAFAELDRGASALERRWDAEVAADLQAIAAELYGLTDAEFAHVLSTFPLVPSQEREAAAERFRTRTRRESW